jgi:DNA-binding GntR family transcriptional regulator
MTIALDRSRYAAPQLYELLRTKIVSLEFLPGAPLSRAHLSEQFQVSQTPVREALLKLAEERLVDVFPQAATRVSLIDISYAQETHFLRRAIELELVRELALNHTAAQIDELKSLVRQHETLRDAHDLSLFTEKDQAFHCFLYEAAHKQELWKLVRSRSGHIDRLRRLHLPAAGKLGRIVSDHTEILAAIARRDVQAAQDHLRAHLSGTLEYVGKILDQYPHFFAAKK